MKLHENNATQSTHQFFNMCDKFWQVFNDSQPIFLVRDSCIDTLDTVLSFISDCKGSLTQEFATRSEVSSHFITWQTMFDLQVQNIR